jgi:hypothetical protein
LWIKKQEGVENTRSIGRIKGILGGYFEKIAESGTLVNTPDCGVLGVPATAKTFGRDLRTIKPIVPRNY